MLIRGVWCVYACILCIDDGDPLACNSLCYEWGGSGARGSARRICLWGGIWIGGLGSSGGEREGLTSCFPSSMSASMSVSLLGCVRFQNCSTGPFFGAPFSLFTTKQNLQSLTLCHGVPFFQSFVSDSGTKPLLHFAFHFSLPITSKRW